MSHAIRIQSPGGPEVLRWEPIEIDRPGRDEVLVRHTAIGVNYFDIYERNGLYPVEMPHILGREAAGVVEALGPGVRNLRLGDRVAYVTSVSGAYSQQRIVPAQRLVRLPDQIDDRTAAALMLKGLTAQMLLRQVYRVRRNDFVVIHAAAGGVGSVLMQWAKHLGARVLAVVGSDEKKERARDLGADHVVLDREDWVVQTRLATRGRGAHVVYDSVGKETFARSLDCVRARGLIVTFGNSSGPVPPFAPLELAKRGSLFLTRPTLFDYIQTRSALVKAVQELFELTIARVIAAQIGQTFDLRDAAEAHRALESRRTIGSTLLLP